jgi:hypothetical protein
MKKLKAIFLICVLANVIGCFYENCDDCTYGEQRLPAYVNESEVMVKITATGNYTYKIYEKFIANGDTLHYITEEWDVPKINDCGLAYNCDYPLTVRMELHFLDEPVKCLIFDGPIKNDGIDTRSSESYKKGAEIYREDFWVDVEYIYTITPEHRNMAKEENCQSPASE